MLRIARLSKVLLLIIIGIVLSGCADKHRRITTTPADLKPSATMDNTFIALPSGDKGTFWEKFHEGAEFAVRDGNYHLKWKLPEIWTPQGQKELMIDAANAKPLGILLSPFHRNLIQDGMAQTLKTMVPVAVAVNGEDSPHQMTFVGSDNTRMGKDIAQWVAQKTPSSGKIAIMNTQTGMRSVDLRLHAILGALEGRSVQQITFPNSDNWKQMKKLDRHEANLQKILEGNLQEYLEQNTDVASLVALDENSTDAAWNILQKMPENKRPQLFGISVEPRLIKACKEGKIAVLIEQNPYEMGKQSMQSLVEFIYSKKRAQHQIFIPYTVVHAEKGTDKIEKN